MIFIFSFDFWGTSRYNTFWWLKHIYCTTEWQRERYKKGKEDRMRRGPQMILVMKMTWKNVWMNTQNWWIGRQYRGRWNSKFRCQKLLLKLCSVRWRPASPPFVSLWGACRREHTPHKERKYKLCNVASCICIILSFWWCISYAIQTVLTCIFLYMQCWLQNELSVGERRITRASITPSGNLQMV